LPSGGELGGSAGANLIPGVSTAVVEWGGIAWIIVA
jgi:hypothetical protein